VADLQRAPDSKKAEAARQTVHALGALVPDLTPADGTGEFAVGDTVKLKSLGQVGEVVEVGSGHCQVRVRGVVARVRKGDLEPAARAPKAVAPLPRVQASKRKEPSTALRVDANTLDLRGHRVEEAFDRVDHFFAEARSRGHDVVFLLHGHGTGALKEALRKELSAHPAVLELMPADADQGGDAFTVVNLR
jgi:DNA mismatch repair protein MutS2